MAARGNASHSAALSVGHFVREHMSTTTDKLKGTANLAISKIKKVAGGVKS
ncbi:MAG: hypothetical protein Q8M19_10420 [Reyranella sp.]|nr:hypothetical protein [Reyranella sp.]